MHTYMSIYMYIEREMWMFACLEFSIYTYCMQTCMYAHLHVHMCKH